MNDNPKQKILIFAAIFLTWMVIVQYMYKDVPPPQANADKEVTKQQITPETKPAELVPNAEKLPGKSANTDATPEPAVVCDNILVTVPDRYEAVFSTRGGALKKFTLLQYYLTAEEKAKNGQNVVIVDEMAANRLSLAIEKLDSTLIRNRNYRLAAAPDNAKLPEGSEEVERSPTNQLVFSTEVDGWQIRKIYTFSAKTELGFELEIEFANLGEAPRKLEYSLIGPSGAMADDTDRWSALEKMSARLSDEKNQTVEIVRYPLTMLDATPWRKLDKAGAVKLQGAVNSEVAAEAEDTRSLLTWLGVKNRFFATALLIQEPRLSMGGELRTLEVDHDFGERNPAYEKIAACHKLTAEVAVNFETMVASKSLAAQKFIFYGGPADSEFLDFDPRLSSLVEYVPMTSWFDSISRLMIRILSWIYAVIPNYGLAIIILTIMVKSLMHPLTRKALTSGQRMQKMQPKMKELQQKYKEDKVRLQQEMMRLYREEGFSPMGGCLPMLIQMPIFFALYGAFARGFAGRQASFIPGWIDDLSQPDSLFSWSYDLPMLGSEFNLLPLIYLVMQILQMNMQPPPADPQAAQMQKTMKFMPIIFAFIFYNMPSGLVLYFTINSMYTVTEHWFIKRKLNAEEAAAAAAPAQAGAGIKGASAGQGIAGKKKKGK